MKMVFSANKRGIPRTSIQPQQPQNQTPVIKLDNQVNNNITNQLLRYGMVARLLSASDCSSCGK
jgi:hypothetical protein